MNLKICYSLICFLFTSALFASELNQPKPQVRVEENFNMDWRFQLSDNPEFREPNFKDSEWRQLDLPHDWSIEGDYMPDKYLGNKNGYFPEGIGWYRKHFAIETSKKNKQFVIQFDGVYMNSEVWVNGEFCGRRPYGYATFQYDITSMLKFGAENVIAVRVDNSVPAASRWYAGSGIYRNVHLIETNFVHFRGMDGIYVTTPVVEKERAIVKADYTIAASFFNDDEIKIYKKNTWLRQEDRWENAPKGHKCILRSIVFDANGKEVTREEKSCEIYNYDKGFKISQDLEVKNPNRWSDKNPYLYTIKSEIEYNGKIIDDQVTLIGIRKLEFNPEKGMMVNGERAILKGVCLHHDGGAVGVAVPDKVMYYRLKKLKEIGCNAIRTSHNPFSPEFYAMCDSMGFYVMDELLDEWTSAWGYNYTDYNTSKAGNGFSLYFNQWADTEMSSTIQRDRNHPSIVIYSVGNELPELRSEPETAQAIVRKLITICHREDNTRPVTFGNNGPKAGIVDELDLIGINYVMENHGHERLGAKIYEKDHLQYPNRLFVGTETSRDELDYFLAYRDNPYVIGQFIWTGIEYFGEVKAPKSGQRGWIASLMDMSCNLHTEGAMYSCAWNDTPQLYITTSETPFDAEKGFKIIPITGEKVYDNSSNRFSWNWDQNGDKYVTVYSNCEEVELKLNGKSLGKKRNDFMKYLTEWKVSYKRGSLQAIGYNKGKKVMQKELFSTEKPAKIVARPYWKSIKLDGVDVDVIEVSITDKNGHLIPEAVNNVKVEVTGSAKLLGIDTGNLFYKGSYRTDHRDVANGYMTFVIQSVKGNEPVRVRLSSEGLESAMLTF